MNAPVLAAKLYIPVPRPRLIARPRLVERLSGGLAKPLTLICAPAGFGKTTLLSEWRAGPGCDFPVAWLAVDEDDNDPVRFLTYVIAALERVQPGVGETIFGLLQSIQPPPPPVVLTLLLNNLSSVVEPFALILDDYHTIQTAQIHEALAFLIEHMPPHMHLVIASRTDPPLPLGRLRGRDQVVEIRAADLRFSPEEAGAFFTEVMDLKLQPTEVAALESRTEGWVAGLQLAALALAAPRAISGQASHSDFIVAFTGSHRYVFDYLIEEVLERQPENLRSFLLETSILERLTGPLCERLTGQRDGTQVLAHLDRSNLFVVPLDAERQWYRYHHLFGQLLRSRLLELWPERVVELHLRAFAWYRDNGFAADAIHHALAAQAVDLAAALIEEVGPAVFMRGEAATVSLWCQALPEVLLQTHPLLCLLYASALNSAGQVDAADACLNQLAGQDLVPNAHSMVAMLRAANACVRGDMDHAATFARQALATAEAAGSDLLSMQISLSHIPLFLASSVLVEALAAQSKTEEAMAAGRHALQLSHRLILKPPWSVVVGQLHLQLSQLHYERDELDAAARHADEHLSIAEQAQHEGYLAYGHAVMARVRQAQARPQEALEQLEAAGRIAQRWRASPEVVRTMSQLVQVWLMRGDLEAVRQWAQAYQQRGGTDDAGFRWLGIRRDIGDIALIRALLAIGQVTAASRLLDQLVPQAQAGGQWGNMIEILTLQALVLQAQGQPTAALQALDQALARGEKAGRFRLFIDAGPDMAALLAGLLRARRLGQVSAESGASTEYIRRLLAACDKSQAPGPPARPTAVPVVAQPALLLERLSQRELEVLRLVVAGCSNQEIGQRLVITTGTVKRHINSIFSKLDVRTRAQAIARARELNLA